jgi:hypothetical protein
MFNSNFGAYVCVGDFISQSIDGFTCVATIHHDDCGDKPDQRDDGFWPSRDKTAAGYVLPENFDVEQAKAENIMRAWKNDEWFYCGVVVTVSRADVELARESLWGVECNYPDSDNSYVTGVAGEVLSEALAAARAKISELIKEETD